VRFYNGPFSFRRIRTTFCAFLGVLLSLLACHPSISEELPVPFSILDMSLEDLVDLRVSTASKKKEKLSEAPATGYVITRQDIRVRGYRTISDVLRDLPGMETIPFYFSEEGTLVPMRGVVGNNKIVLLLNGVRLNPPGGENMMFRDDVTVRMAEQIEVIYGPGSTLYGQDAISAVINVITRKDDKAGQILAAAGNLGNREGFASFSENLTKSNENSVRVSGYVSKITSDLTNLSKKYPEWWKQYQAIMDRARPDSEMERWQNSLNGMFRLENNTNALQAWFRESSRSSSEGGFTPILQYVEEAEWHDRSLVLQGKSTSPLTDKVNLDSSLTFNRYEIDPETRYVFPVSSTELFLNDFKYGLGTGYTLEEKVDAAVSDNLNITVGFEASQYNILPKSSVPGRASRGGNIVAQAGTLQYYTQRGDSDSGEEIARATELSYQNYGLYAEGAYRLSEEIKFILGGRYDDNSRFNANPFSPRASAIYSNKESHLTAKYIFSKAFVAPAPYFAYNVFDNGNAINISNPDLEPERATSNEINLTWAYERTMVGASVYYNQQSNLILVGDLSLPANIIDDEVYTDVAGTNKRDLTHSVNGGKRNATGFDVYTRYSGTLLSPWASFSYVDYESRFGETKSGLPQISRVNARLGVSYQILENLSFTPSIIYRSAPSNVTNSFTLDNELEHPYQINAHLLYTPFEAIDVFLDVQNLTDNRYALRGILGPVPQEALTVKLGMRYSF